jgi:chromosome segregation ATPase
MSSSDVSLEYALADAGALKGLSSRESELVRKAGERVFELSRKAAERDREIDRLKLELAHLREMLDETIRSREVLSSQVVSLQADAERALEERAELRTLLAGSQAQVQQLLARLLESGPLAQQQPSPGPLRLGKQAPQRGSRAAAAGRSRTFTIPSIPAGRIRGWLGRI